MNTKQKTVVASAVALLLGTVGCAAETADEGDVGMSSQGLKCQGLNECKGMSECAGADGANECQGMNECKGMGWVSVESEAECTDQGGTIIS